MTADLPPAPDRLSGLRRFARRLLRPYLPFLFSARPLSDVFGFDRGTPVDRYYIDRFLTAHSAQVQGRVLEIGDDAYSRRFGADRITRQDILHVHAGNPAATLIGDISVAGVLPGQAFDCIVLTQTLHLIFDMRTAVEHLHAALAPGGVLLVTVPGISQIDAGEWGEGWYWSLTGASGRRLFSEIFGPDQVQVEVFGNVRSASAFLYGAAAEEVGRRALDPADPCYPVIVGVVARKA